MIFRKLVNSFFIILIVLTSCMDFRMTQRESKAYFSQQAHQPEFDSIRVGERSIHFVSTNNGKDTLVAFIHGSPGSWTAFIDFFKIDSLIKRVDIVSIDRPGFGNSDYGIPEPSIERQAKLMHEVMLQYSHPTKILVGHSLGGPIIARMAMDYPDAYNRLVMVAPSVDPNMEQAEWYRSYIQSRMGKRLIPTDFWVSNEEIVSLKGELTAMLHLWSTINIKVVVIQGTSDSFVPKENGDFVQKMLPDSLVEIRWLNGVDHFIPWTHPDEIVKALF